MTQKPPIIERRDGGSLRHYVLHCFDVIPGINYIRRVSYIGYRKN